MCSAYALLISDYYTWFTIVIFLSSLVLLGSGVILIFISDCHDWGMLPNNDIRYHVIMNRTKIIIAGVIGLFIFLLLPNSFVIKELLHYKYCKENCRLYEWKGKK